MIDPGEQITVDEQLLAQQGGEIGQAPAEAGAQLQILEQEQGDERGPDLNVQGVGAGWLPVTASLVFPPGNPGFRPKGGG